MDKINKLTLPATILIASIVLGGFFYVSQLNKQRSIDRQQEAKAEQEKKEYVAKRKIECYGVYEKERVKFNNVDDFEYSEERDACIVKYKSDKPAKSTEECGKILETNTLEMSQSLRDIVSEHYVNCIENWFSKEF